MTTRVVQWLRHATVCALVTVACLASSTARGQDASAYEREIDEALAAYERSAFDVACAHFRAAHRALPGPRTLRGIGMCSFELNDHVEAYRSLRAALVLTSADRPLTDAHRAHVEQLLARVEPLVAVYTDLPPRATLTIDDAPVEPEADGTVILALGEHVLVVTRDDRSVRARVQVRGGERAPLPFDRRALLADPITEPPPATPPTPAPPPAPLPSSAPPSQVAIVDLGTRRTPPPPEPKTFQLGGRLFAAIGAWDGGAGAVGAWGPGLDLDLAFVVSDDVLVGPTASVQGAFLLDGNAASETWQWLGHDLGLALVWHVPGTPLALRGAVAFSVAWRARLADDRRRTGDAFASAGASVTLGARIDLVPRVLYVALDARGIATELGAFVGTLGLGVETPR